MDSSMIKSADIENVKGKRSNSASVVQIDDLEDDELIEIFLRLSHKSVHRLKSVCKRWLSVISDPRFARSYTQSHFPNVHFLLLDQHITSKDESRSQFRFLPIDQHNNKISTTPSIIPLSFDFNPAFKHPSGNNLMVICNELVLLVSLYEYYDDPHRSILYVCNPFTKQWMQLPTLYRNGIRVGYTGFTCYRLVGDGEDMTRVWANNNGEHIIANPNKIEFTVVHILQDGKEDAFVIYTFSSLSDTAGWTMFRVPFPPGATWPKGPCIDKVVFSNGKFCWTGVKCIFMYDPFNKPYECDIIRSPPIDFNEHDFLHGLNLATSEGHLRVVSEPWTGRFTVWELVDYDKEIWVVKCDIATVMYEDCYDLYFKSFTRIDGDKAYWLSHFRSILLFDMKTASLQPVFTLPKETNMYKISWLGHVEPFVLNPWPTTFPLLVTTRRGSE